MVVDGCFSNFVPVTSGIPQGSVLGPILFVIFINDLPEVINVCFKMFADDSKMYGRVTTIDQAGLVQDSINNAVKWAEDWQMFFNYNKCKHLHIGNHDLNFEYFMSTDSESFKVQNVNSENDLGLIVDRGLKLSEHINEKISKANKILGLIFKSFTFMDKDMFVTSFKTLVRPHLEYASPTWSLLYKKDKIAIENVQRRAIRLVNCLKHMDYSERLKALGLPTLEYRRERADMVEVYKILHDIDKVDKSKPFTLSSYTSTRGHTLKLSKRRSRRLSIRTGMFSNRVVEVWNSLPETVVMAPSLNSFKHRLNKAWKNHPSKFCAQCYIPGIPTRIVQHPNASQEAELFD